MKILVTDCNQRVGLTILRSLGSVGHNVIPSSSQKKAIGFYSKYSGNFFIYPSKRDLALFQKVFHRHVVEEKYDVVFLSNESTIISLLPIMDKLRQISKIAISSNQHINLALDKTKTISQLNNSNIKTIQDSLPKTYTFDSISDFILTRFTNYPLVIKQRKSSFLKDDVLINSHKVGYANNYKELKNHFVEICKKFKLEDDNLPIVQEYIPGEPFGFFALLNKGETVAHFSHHRLREFPPTGGPSTYRESFLDKDLTNLGLKILNCLKWDGIAMVEFRKDNRDGKYKLMEVNGRFWGSLRLSVVSGVDFPSLYLKVLMNEKIVPFKGYKEGVRCRWLMPGDINYLKKIFFLESISRRNRLTLLLNWFRFNRNDFYDYYTFDDPLPALLVTKRELLNQMRLISR